MKTEKHCAALQMAAELNHTSLDVAASTDLIHLKMSILIRDKLKHLQA